MICFDLRFPELSRHLVRQGAVLLVVSALWPKSRLDNFELLCRTRAMESQVFLVAANGAGISGGIELGGGTIFCGPDGSVLARAPSSGQELVVCRMDLSSIGERRAFFDSSRSPVPWRLKSAGKVTSLDHLLRCAAARRAGGQKMVFTNGCFDILHAGHVSYLERARSFGDFLVVGLNSDASVRSIKGPERPINPEHERARVLAALQCVDYVVLFHEETPLRLIDALSPDVLVKGADWKEDEIVGASLVKDRGGRVERIAFEMDTSTTAIIERVRGGA